LIKKTCFDKKQVFFMFGQHKQRTKGVCVLSYGPGQRACRASRTTTRCKIRTALEAKPSNVGEQVS
jgi:hypothetical protein